MLNKKSRRLLANKVRLPRHIENGYVVALQKIMKQVHAHVVKTLNLRQDAYTEHTSKFDVLGVQIQVAIEGGVGKAFEKMSKQVQTANTKAMIVQGLDPTKYGLGDVVKQARDKNVHYMVQAGRDYAYQVQDVLEQPETVGMSIKELSELLQARADVSESHAALIARTSTGQLNSAITKSKQTSAGITSYVWSGSLDERERDSHRELEGQTFDWLTGAPSLEGLNPGEDFSCRCVSLCVLPDDDSED